MASSNLLKLFIPQTQLRKPSFPIKNSKTLIPSLPVPPTQQTHHLHQSKILSLSRNQQKLSSSPSSSAFTPPSSREEAILQAKTCLSTTLQKSLNNPLPIPSRKLKRQRQPRYRVEIPVVDDSPSSLSQLALDVFSDLSITRKGAKPSILILWSNPTLAEEARRAFLNSPDSPSSVTNSDLASVSTGVLNSSDVIVFLAPEASLLEDIKRIGEAFDPKPVVLFNPKWVFEEETGFGLGLGSYVGSFEVIYSFMGLEVRGILSRRKGVVCKSVRDGVFSGENWVVMVEEEEEEEERKGNLKVVMRFKKRPSISEVESVLYNLMAVNSPVTKSVKFLRDFASNVMGKKEKN